jgi:hypothetical protein
MHFADWLKMISVQGMKTGEIQLLIVHGNDKITNNVTNCGNRGGEVDR